MACRQRVCHRNAGWGKDRIPAAAFRDGLRDQERAREASRAELRAGHTVTLLWVGRVVSPNRNKYGVMSRREWSGWLLGGFAGKDWDTDQESGQDVWEWQ